MKVGKLVMLAAEIVGALLAAATPAAPVPTYTSVDGADGRAVLMLAVVAKVPLVGSVTPVVPVNVAVSA